MVAFNISQMIEKIRNAHPKNVVNMVGDIDIGAYTVRYSYKTNRGNEKTAEKIFLLPGYEPDFKEYLNKYVEDFNKENPHRAISNVKFLEARGNGKLVI